jgi:hypothetical protein
MANYANTLKLDALAMLQENANKDFRPAMYGATNAFNDYKRDVILNFEDFQNEESEPDLRSRKVDYLRRDTDTVNSSRSASLTGKMGTSTRDTLTFVTYAREFTLSDDNARSNTFNASRQLAAQMRNARLDIASEIESDAVTKLEAFKSQTDPSSNLSIWDSTNYVNEIANANSTEYYNYMLTEMRKRDYNGPLQEIHTYSAEALINYQTAQGVSNSANLQFQYPDFEFYKSNSVTNLSDYFCTSYVCEQRSLGLVDWIPPKNRGNLEHGIWDFTAMPDPMGIFDSGLALAIYKTVQDSSAGGQAIGGNTQDAVWLYEMSIDVAFFIPTITSDKLVYKYGLLSS